jgi:hypothetical protein
MKKFIDGFLKTFCQKIIHDGMWLMACCTAPWMSIKEKKKKSQNNGVCVTTEEGPTYYGKLTHIIEVTYCDLTRYVPFKCNLTDIQPNKEYIKDEYGFDLLNFNNLIHTANY